MNKVKRKDIGSFLIGFAVLLLINFICSLSFLRFDLTAENRYSISEPTKKLLEEIDDNIYITVYLEGNFPASFKRLRNETKELLDEFSAYSDNNIDYEFVNPSSSPNSKERDRVYKNLYEIGLRPTDLEITDDDGISKKIVWPGAIIRYQEKEVPVQLLKSQFGAAPELILNQSIESLEYELASAIKKTIKVSKKRIAFIEGHGELNKYETADIVGSLRENYYVERVRIDGNLKSLQNRRYPDSSNAIVRNDFDAIIIADPDSSFNDKDKFIIDQFAMYGGKIIWLIDAVEADMDSLKNRHTTIAIAKQLNLDDQLFSYGVRINTDLVQDLRAAPIPIVSGQYGNQVKTKLFPWLYYPLLFSKNDHPINKNLDVVRVQFANSIDLVGNDQLKKSVILSTSSNTKLTKSPTRISLNMLSYEPPVEQFKKKNIPLGVLVEGKFKSVFRNRLTKRITDAGEIKFKEQSPVTQMLFISDGDFIKNRYKAETNEFFNLGFDQYTKQLYGNKNFFTNAISYMLDDSKLILSNSKSFKIRQLNTQLIKQNRSSIQLINTVLPIILIVIIGLIIHWIRKRKYTTH